MQVAAAAAKSIVDRRGLSKVRHLDTATLSIQEHRVCPLLPLGKIAGSKSETSLMTKNLDVQLVEIYMDMLGLKLINGRSKSAVKLHAVPTRTINDHIDDNDGNNDNDSNSNEPSESLDCRGQGGLWHRSHSSWR